MNNIFENFKLEIELTSANAFMPTRATNGDAGLDFYTPKDIIIYPQEDILIPLDLKVKFPKGYVLIFMEKSGVSTKKKCDIGAKVIDSGYRGIVHAHLFNNSFTKIYFKAGEKVVQGIIMPIWDGQPIQVNKIENDSERGVGGFGSTGN